MALTLGRLTTAAVLAAGLALPGLSLAQAPAFFTAELAAPATQDRVIAGGMVWRCAGTTCTAARNTARPLRICRELQRELGIVQSFAVEGVAMGEADLARCNG